MITQGKVSFGFRYSQDDIDREEAYANAIQSFEEGISRVFIDEIEIESLNQNNLKEDARLSLVRLKMNTGQLLLR